MHESLKIFTGDLKNAFKDLFPIIAVVAFFKGISSIDQPTTLRENKSITITKYNQPYCVRMYVISPTYNFINYFKSQGLGDANAYKQGYFQHMIAKVLELNQSTVQRMIKRTEV